MYLKINFIGVNKILLYHECFPVNNVFCIQPQKVFSSNDLLCTGMKGITLLDVINF